MLALVKLFKVYKYKHPRYPYCVYIPIKDASKKLPLSTRNTEAHKTLCPFNLSIADAVNIVSKALKELAPYEADIPMAV